MIIPDNYSCSVDQIREHQLDMMRTNNQERRLSVCSSDSGFSNAFKNAFVETRTMQNYESSQDYILAMTEDLAEWFNLLYERNLNVDNFFSTLSDGILLCQHALEVQSAGQDYIQLNNCRDLPMKIGNVVPVIPDKGPAFRKNAQQGTFLARDNVTNFIMWCRSFGIPASLTFETEDLVLVKNPRSVIVCLLEIARIGAKFGMEVPDIVHLEEEIDAEIEADQQQLDINDSNRSVDSGTMCDTSDCDATSEVNDLDYEDTEFLDAQGKLKIRSKKDRSYNVNHPMAPGNYVRKPLYQKPDRGNVKKDRPKVDMKSLDEMVREILAQCTCEETFPMKRVKEGKYLFGDKSTLIFVRILRNHVMVRVGGGWSTLNDFLEKYDACRKCNKQIVTKISVPAAPVEGTTSKTDEASLSDTIPPQILSLQSGVGEGTCLAEDKSKIEANHLFDKPSPGESATATVDPAVLLDQLDMSKYPSDTTSSNIGTNHFNTKSNGVRKISSKESSPNTTDKTKPRSSSTISGTTTAAISDRKKSAPVNRIGSGSLGRRSSLTTADCQPKSTNPPIRKKSFQSTQDSVVRPSSAQFPTKNRSNSLFNTESPLAKNNASVNSASLRPRASTSSQVPNTSNNSLSKSLPFKSSNNAKSTTPVRVVETRRPSSAVNSTAKSSKTASLSKDSKPNSNRETPEREDTPNQNSAPADESQNLKTNKKTSRIPICTQQFPKKKPLIPQSSASAPTSESSSPASSRRNSIKSTKKGPHTPTKTSSLQNQKGQAVSDVKKAAQVLQESTRADD